MDKTLNYKNIEIVNIIEEGDKFTAIQLNQPNVKAAELNGKIAVNLTPVFFLVFLLHLQQTYQTVHTTESLSRS